MSQFDRERLQTLVGDGWLRSQRHPDAGLWIYNYTKRTQYEKHWTAETLVCRGLFRMLDGKSFDDLIWKAIRPEASTPGEADLTGMADPPGEADRTSARSEIDCAASAP